MKNLDIKLSKEVAEEASKEIINLKKKITQNKDVYIALLQDSLDDNRKQNTFHKKVTYILSGIIVFLIAVVCAMGIYNQKVIKDLADRNAERFIEFLDGTAVTSKIYIDTNNQSYNDGSINVQK